MIAECARYVAGVRVAEPMGLRDAGSMVDQTDGFVWVALSDPTADEMEDQSESIYLHLQETARLARTIHPMLTIFDRLERGELADAPPALSPLLRGVSDHARARVTFRQSRHRRRASLLLQVRGLAVTVVEWTRPVR